MIKTKLLIILFLISSNAPEQVHGQQPASHKTLTFSEGIIYSRTTFPGHKLDDSIKTLDFENGDFVQQINLIQALKKYQQTIRGENEQEIKDQFFISGMMLLPLYSIMYLTPTTALIKSDALGYHQDALINNTEHKAIIVLADRDKMNQGTISFDTKDMPEVWQKYQVDEAQYSIKHTNETALVAGYRCKKVIYTFNGTTRGLPVTNYVVNMEPRKVTVWYSDEISPAINLMHTLHFELNKAVLKFEVEYDNQGKNKMLVEVTKFLPKKLHVEELELKEFSPKVEHQKNGVESGMMIMQVMMHAISQLTK